MNGEPWGLVLGMLAVFHVSMEACKYEVANRLLPLRRSYLDRPHLAAWQTHLKRNCFFFQ